MNYSSRSRRVRLRVLPGKVVVTAPERTSRKLIDLFVRSRTDWIAEKLALFDSVEAPSPEIIPDNGAALWVFGQKLTLRVIPHRQSPVIKLGNVLTGEKHLSVNELRKWLDSILMKTAVPIIEKYSTALRVSPEKIRLGNARARWGSCSSKGVIMVNRKLVHAPLFVVDYIAAHETAHLVHRNHSAKFHLELSRLGVEVKQARKWLRLQGAFLIQ